MNLNLTYEDLFKNINEDKLKCALLHLGSL